LSCISKTASRGRCHETRTTVIRALNAEPVQDDRDQAPSTEPSVGINLTQTRQRIGFLLDRIGSAHFDRNESRELFVSGEPYRGKCAVAEFVNDAVAVLKTIADLYWMKSPESIIFESLDVLD
jgi:hypothetical protein